MGFLADIITAPRGSEPVVSPPLASPLRKYTRHNIPLQAPMTPPDLVKNDSTQENSTKNDSSKERLHKEEPPPNLNTPYKH